MFGWFFYSIKKEGTPALSGSRPRDHGSARGPRSRKRSYRVLAPGWLDHFIFNKYYPTEEEFLFALADAVHEEYRTVVAAGFVLQIDDPGLPDWWDMLKPEPTDNSVGAIEIMNKGFENKQPNLWEDIALCAPFGHDGASA
jgi:hypothetical protein